MTGALAILTLHVALAAAPDTPPHAMLDLGERLSDVEVTGEPGQPRLRVHTVDGVREFAPDDFARALQWTRDEQNRHGFLFKLFNITSWTGVLWVTLGLGGQLAFTARMLVQWLSSERAKRSVVPVSFWWMSLAGASMLILYFVWRKDVVGVLGQSTGWIIYIRNLLLVYKHRPAPPITADPAPEPELAK